MTVDTKPVTAEEHLEMPDDGVRRELTKGGLRVPATGTGLRRGGDIRRTQKPCQGQQPGRTYVTETGFKVGSDPDTALAPDAAFLSRERTGSAREVEGFFRSREDIRVLTAEAGWRLPLAEIFTQEA